MVSGLKGKTYRERLSEVGLTTLEERRKRGDMIEVWKVLHHEEDVNVSTWFTMASDRGGQQTRQSSDKLNLVLPSFKHDIRKYFWSVRVIEDWNSLPSYIKSATNINSFKNLYDEHQDNL